MLYNNACNEWHDMIMFNDVKELFNECMNEREEMKALWIRPYTGKPLRTGPTSVIHRRPEVVLCRTEISVSLCRMRVVLFNLWTSSCSSVINKLHFKQTLVLILILIFEFWFWFWNLILAPAQNSYLFILKILFSLDQNISSWLFCFCFLFII